MRRNKDIVMRTVCNEPYLIAEGGENVDLNCIISLNETAAFLWQAMGEGEFNEEELVNKLTAEYEVSNEEAYRAVSDLLEKFKDIKVVE